MMIERSCVIEHHYEKEVLAVPASVGVLRDLAERRLARWGAAREFIEDATLVLSELVTNSVDACRGSGLRFAMYAYSGTLVIEVHDSSPERPVQRTAGEHDIRGRGLTIVGALSESWGVRQGENGGKCTWARLTVSTP
jgi:anti-sigma regulatory factor (Ser/Thr protein kinase)